jgi:hypothetical protein
MVVPVVRLQLGAEIVQLGGSDGDGCAPGQRVRIYIVILYLLPRSKTVIRWAMVVARKQSDSLFTLWSMRMLVALSVEGLDRTAERFAMQGW